MSRNKYPEETQRKILEVSRRLFHEKGYEQTTIQDIVDALGMSKGAVYHHFKSKADIYDRITDEYYDQTLWMQDLASLPGKNALERIRSLFCLLLTDPGKRDLDRLAPNNPDPRLLELIYRASLEQTAPLLRRFIEEGNADGSIHVARPKETSEIFMLLMNLWVGPASVSKADFLSKLRCLQNLSDDLGMPILDDAVFCAAAAYYDATAR